MEDSAPLIPSASKLLVLGTATSVIFDPVAKKRDAEAQSEKGGRDGRETDRSSRWLL